MVDSMECDGGGSPTAYKISVVKAIQTLDNLNDHIVQFIFNPDQSAINFPSDIFASCQHQQQLKSSVIVIRRLLLDAQSRFRRMVEENKSLASRIDGTISYAAREVSHLRMELEQANKKVEELTKGSGSDSGIDDTQSSIRDSVELLQTDLVRLRQENASLVDQVQHLTDQVKLQLVDEHDSNMDHTQCRLELRLVKDALIAMREERKKLKAEKIELLNQIKQLYVTLEDKESEFRDFIRNYEHRNQETDNSLKQMARQNDSSEKEKWDLVKRIRETSETAVLLKTQLDAKENHIQDLESHNSQLRDQLDSRRLSRYTPDVISPGGITVKTTSSEELPPYETPPASITYGSKDDPFNLQSTPVSLHPDMIPNFFNFLHTSTPEIHSEPNRNNNHSFPSNTLSATHPHISGNGADSKKKKRRSFGSFSRVFSKGRSRRSIAVPIDIYDDFDSNVRISLLNSNNYQEKLNLVQSSQSIPLHEWKANQVLAWLEIVLSMPIYGRACAENIKSGKVLLELSDSELFTALDISNILHQRKLRLAIDEQRHPFSIDYSKATNLDHTWISHRWLPEIGLPQYIDIFETQLIDGRVLNTLSKRDLEKHLNIARKFHQASILHAIELMRRVDFDREELCMRRDRCQNEDTDPLVWSNQRVIKWVNSIDLGEYSGNIKESGINGSLMVLEPSFTADILATALHIPSNKPSVRKHLKTELDTLLSQARSALDTLTNDLKKQQSFRSQKHSKKSDTISRKNSFRGSLGRAFGRKVRDDLKNMENDVSKQRLSISGPISAPIHTKSFSLSPNVAAMTTV